ncbi:MAG: aspartyl/asparaginyl beta-hydroxylase domain-containing protein [Actinobacteria bacterium]|nr:aspartyl/asparaginyl beta-hydroxylase domain-containing protein [Actinomycetota bacterium]
MNYVKLPELEETGYVVLESYDQSQDPQEWFDIEFVDWKSSGDTRFAPLASAYGDLECNGFWHHNPPKTDKDGVWVEANVERAPRLKARAEEPGANIGRCRVIELKPNEYADSIWNLHQDDNNRLNPEGTGWIVRGFFNLTDNPDSYMILREDKDDPSTETRIPLPAGAQVIIDTQRLWHAVWHTGDEPRYCLITSWESGPELGAYIRACNPRSRVDNAPLDPAVIAAAQALVARRRAEKEAASGAMVDVMSEA